VYGIQDVRIGSVVWDIQHARVGVVNGVGHGVCIIEYADNGEVTERTLYLWSIYILEY
jgi:hypothetical protein